MQNDLLAPAGKLFTWKDMAGTTGLEPAASAVTGQRSNQLNYDPAIGWDGSAETRVTSRLAQRSRSQPNLLIVTDGSRIASMR